MLRTLLVGATALVAAISYPSEVRATPYSCGPGTYQNAYGVCLPAADATWSATPLGNAADAEFWHLLTQPNQEHPMVIWNFPAVKAQALVACQQTNYETPYAAVKDLQALVPSYTFDDAVNIVDSGLIVYCPQNDWAPSGKWPTGAGT